MKHTLIAFVFLFFISCSNDDEVDFTAQNEQEILDYLEDNDLVAQKSPTGLYYIINELGDGAQAEITSNVTVVYKGYYTNGTVFDQSDQNGAVFDVRNLISGFTEGLTYFKEGGEGILIIPSRLAYGNNGSRSIPGGAVIIFDVNLISVND